MFDDVVQSWDDWAASRRGTRTRERWARSDRRLRRWAVADLRQPRSSPRTDAMQAALVGLSQSGDSAAATTLLVQLRPGLASVATQLAAAGHFTTFTESSAEVRSAFHEVVMGHDLGRRPARIAANLLLDTRQRLTRRPARSSCPSPMVSLDRDGPPLAAGPSALDRIEERLDLLDAVTGALDALPGSGPSKRTTATLAYRAWFLEEPSNAIAADLGIAHNAARTRLSRLRTAVRDRYPDALPLAG